MQLAIQGKKSRKNHSVYRREPPIPNDLIARQFNGLAVVDHRCQIGLLSRVLDIHDAADVDLRRARSAVRVTTRVSASTGIRRNTEQLKARHINAISADIGGRTAAAHPGRSPTLARRGVEIAGVDITGAAGEPAADSVLIRAVATGSVDAGRITLAGNHRQVFIAAGERATAVVRSNTVVVDAVAVAITVVIQTVVANFFRWPTRTIRIQVINQAVAVIIQAIPADFSAVGGRTIDRASLVIFITVAQAVSTVNGRTTVLRTGRGGLAVIADIVSAIRIGPAVLRTGRGVFAVSRLTNTISATANPAARQASRLPCDAIDLPIAVQAVALFRAFGDAIAANLVGRGAIGGTSVGVFAVVAQAVAAERALIVGTIVRENATIVADQAPGVETVVLAGLAGEVASFALLPILIEPAVAAAHLHQRVGAVQRSQAIRVSAVHQAVAVVVPTVIADFGYSQTAGVGTSHKKQKHKNKRKFFHN